MKKKQIKRVKKMLRTMADGTEKAYPRLVYLDPKAIAILRKSIKAISFLEKSLKQRSD